MDIFLIFLHGKHICLFLWRIDPVFLAEILSFYLLLHSSSLSYHILYPSCTLFSLLSVSSPSLFSLSLSPSLFSLPSSLPLFSLPFFLPASLSSLFLSSPSPSLSNFSFPLSSSYGPKISLLHSLSTKFHHFTGGMLMSFHVEPSCNNPILSK